jgi:ketosteroid isomerase-like protein
MKKQNSYLAGLAFMALVAFGCSEAKENTEEHVDEVAVAVAGPDMAAIKTIIQEKETAFAVAQTAGDADAIMAFYSDDAITMGNDQPAISDVEARRKDVEEGIAKAEKNSVTTFNVTEVFGSENQVTEIGLTTVKDADGKVLRTGKYMAIWEKRGGDYICIRDIYNNDAPKK